MQHARLLPSVRPPTGAFSPFLLCWRCSLCQVASAPPLILPLSPSSSSLLFLPPTSYYLLNSHYYWFLTFLSHSPHYLVLTFFSSLSSQSFPLTWRLDHQSVKYMPFQYPLISCVPWIDRCAKSGHQQGEKCLRTLLSNFRSIRVTGRYWLTSNFDLVGVQWSPGLGIFSIVFVPNGSAVKNLPAVRKMRVRSLGQ